MNRLLRIACTGLVGLTLAFVASPQPMEGASHRMQIPLRGCRGNLHANGTATFSSSYGETSTRDGQKLVIVVQNVALPAGTELLVFVHENEVGTMKLDKQRNGRFVIESEFRHQSPSLGIGSFVVLKLEDGTNVMW
jgi:hypothetical protein